MKVLWLPSGKFCFNFARLDGATNTEDRLTALREFNANGLDIPVLLVTTQASGVGLNLQTADTVILLDPEWNPSADLRCTGHV